MLENTLHKTMHHDIVIVGGGLVGATLALVLARNPGLRIALVEKNAFDADSLNQHVHPSFDARNTALSNGTCELFDQLGVWQTMRSGAEPVRLIEVSDEGGFGKVLIDAAQESVDALGYVIENRLMGRALLQALLQTPNVLILDRALFSVPRAIPGGFEGSITREGITRPVKSSLLVVADGADSDTCVALGIGVRRKSYGQTGIVTTMTTDALHNGRAWERFSPQGPIAVLPQTEGRLGVTWCVDNHEADRLMEIDDTQFMQVFQERFGLAAGRFLRVGRRDRYPLRLVQADEQIRPHLVVLGNAAHGLHPVAGQGLNMALRDVVVLARHVHDAVVAGENPGAFVRLSAYFDERGRDQSHTTVFSDGLTRLFSNASPVLRTLRNVGMALFDVVPGAKHALARHAMGRAVSMRIP